MAPCYYKTLGVSVKAAPEDIKKAFRAKALLWHPDRNPGDPAAALRFREAAEAYETLCDPERRACYDRLRGHRRAPRAAPAPQRGPRSAPGRPVSPEACADALSELFGVRPGEAAVRRGADLRFDLQVLAGEAQSGVIEHVSYGRVVFCTACAGRGVQALSPCGRCRGAGRIEETATIAIRVPAGCRPGTRLRVAGAGDQPSPGMPAGDLVIVLHVAPR